MRRFQILVHYQIQRNALCVMTITRKALIWSLETLESNTILGRTREPVTENMFSDPSSQAPHTTFLSRKLKNIQCNILVQNTLKGQQPLYSKLRHIVQYLHVFFFSQYVIHVSYPNFLTPQSLGNQRKGAVIGIHDRFLHFEKKN